MHFDVILMLCWCRVGVMLMLFVVILMLFDVIWMLG